MLELYHDWRSFCSLKVRVCLAEKRLDWTSRYVDLMKLEHTSPEYTKLNPNGVVPTLVHDGQPIIESTVINEYLEEAFPDVRLSPEDPLGRAHMRRWTKFGDDTLLPAIRFATVELMLSRELSKLSDDELETLLAKHPNPERANNYRKAARNPTNPEKVEESRRDMVKALDKLEQQLDRTHWLAGDMFTLADVAAAPFVDRLEEMKFGGLWDGRASVEDWIARLKQRPSYAEAVPRDEQRFEAAQENLAA